MFHLAKTIGINAIISVRADGAYDKTQLRDEAVRVRAIDKPLGPEKVSSPGKARRTVVLSLALSFLSS